jgi:DNA repair protein RadD
VTAAIRLCPSCGFEFKFKEKDDLALRNDDIMGFDSVDMSVRLWAWRVHTSKVNGKQMLKVTYYGELSDPPVDEYFTVLHDGYAGTKARESILAIAARAGSDPRQMNDLPSSVAVLQRGTPPKQITYRRKGKFYQVERKKWIN